MDAATFRTDFPEFASTVNYPDSAVTRFIGLAASFLNPCVWTDQPSLDFATELFTAHNLVLSRRDTVAAMVGGVPGEVNGPKSAKAVDKVSVSQDTGAVTLENGGQWNLTSYGVRLLQLARMWGAGAFQLMPSGSGG